MLVNVLTVKSYDRPTVGENAQLLVSIKVTMILEMLTQTSSSSSRFRVLLWVVSAVLHLFPAQTS